MLNGFGFQAVGDELLDSIVSDNIPIFTEEEKYNQTVLSSVERIEAKLNGEKVPGEALCMRLIKHHDRRLQSGHEQMQGGHHVVDVFCPCSGALIDL